MELDWMFISISKSQSSIQSYSLKWHLFQFQGIGAVAWLLKPVGDGRPAAAGAKPLDLFGDPRPNLPSSTRSSTPKMQVASVGDKSPVLGLTLYI